MHDNQTTFAELLARHPAANLMTLAKAAQTARRRFQTFPRSSRFANRPLRSVQILASDPELLLLFDLLDEASRAGGVESLPLADDRKPKPAVRLLCSRAGGEVRQLEWRPGRLDGYLPLIDFLQMAMLARQRHSRGLVEGFGRSVLAELDSLLAVLLLLGNAGFDVRLQGELPEGLTIDLPFVTLEAAAPAEVTGTSP